MLWGARFLAFFLWVSLLLTTLSMAFLYLTLVRETPRLDFSRRPARRLTRPVNFETLLSRFYLPAGEASSASPESLSARPPALRAIFGGARERLALLSFGKDLSWVREGERVRGWRVVSLGPDFAVLEFGGRKITLKLFSEKGEKAGPSGLSGESSPGKLIISREEIARLTSDLGSLFSKIRLRPHFYAGKMDGVLVEYVAPASLFYKAGLRAGDVVLSINGIPVRKNEDAFRILESVKTASALAVKIRRGGRILTLRAEVR